MPRCHFHIYDGAGQTYQTGADLSGWDEARVTAIGLAGDVLKESAHQIMSGEDWHMEVTDDTGLILFRLDFSVYETPTIRRIWTNDHTGKTD